MNELGTDVLAVAKRYLGPAAQSFMNRELKALGVVELADITPAHVTLLAQRAKRSAARLMDGERVEELASALAACAAAVPASPADERAVRITLLREAVALAPGDLATHRRLAASLANADDVAGACAEYARFVDVAIAEGDTRRAWLEISYARETLGERAELMSLVDKLAPRTQAAPAPTPTPQPVAPAPAAPRIAAPLVASIAPRPTAPAATAPRPAGPQTLRPAAAPAASAPRTATPMTIVRQAPVASAPAAAPAPEPRSPEQELAAADSHVIGLIGSHDPSATGETLRTARGLLDAHKLQAASDLLLDYIAAGFDDREAQRLLVEVDCGLGKRDIAREKCRLLGTAYRLDGRLDAASDVERFAAFI